MPKAQELVQHNCRLNNKENRNVGTLSGYTYKPSISNLGTLQLELPFSLYIHGIYVNIMKSLSANIIG